MRIKTIFAITLFFAFAANMAFAQTTVDVKTDEPTNKFPGIFDNMFKNDGDPVFYASMGYNQVNGLGEFGDNINIQSPGFDIKVGGYLKNLPLAIGVNAGFQFYDYMSRPGYYNFSREDYVSGFNHFMGTIRFTPKKGVLTPYIEASAGMVWAYSSMNLHFDNDHWDDYDHDYNDTEYFHNDITYAGNIGGGVLIKLFSFGNGGLHLDLNGKYGLGGELETVKENSLRITNGKVNYELSKDPVKYYSFNAGLFVNL